MVHNMIKNMAQEAKRASQQLSMLPSDEKNQILQKIAMSVRAAEANILQANEKDMIAARNRGLDDALLDRLCLNHKRIIAIADTIDRVAQLPDPVGQIIDVSYPPNGLKLSRVRIAIGVLAIIYDSRPNVTADAAALAIKSGNAAILRGGSEAVHSNHAIYDAFVKAISKSKLSPNIVQIIPNQIRPHRQIE